MAVWAEHADVVGSIVLPIFVDVLDFERHPSGKGLRSFQPQRWHFSLVASMMRRRTVRLK
ncbi:MAG TPA: hypothetical protein VIW69_07180 [Candidatus Elarobacter sp.]